MGECPRDGDSRHHHIREHEYVACCQSAGAPSCAAVVTIASATDVVAAAAAAKAVEVDVFFECLTQDVLNDEFCVDAAAKPFVSVRESAIRNHSPRHVVLTRFEGRGKVCLQCNHHTGADVVVQGDDVRTPWRRSFNEAAVDGMTAVVASPLFGAKKVAVLCAPRRNSCVFDGYADVHGLTRVHNAQELYVHDL